MAALKPAGHAAVSLALGGGTYLVTGSPGSVGVALLTGVLVDLDHLPDFYRWFILDQSNRIWLLLHSYELLIPAILLSYATDWNPLALAGTLGFLVHLLCDQWANGVRPLTYFFTYRALKGFRTSEMAPWTAESVYSDLLHLPFMPRLLPPTIAWIRKLSRR
ncbi:MAG: hypothetical protein HW388_482 [Dehalococcoidia bacterium]|nr:hypothetical protein [Dehalococcoidia bacterium]